VETSVKQSLEFAILQSVAECYLDGIDRDTRPDNEPLKLRLRDGNNHFDYSPNQGQGKTKLTEQQIDWFFANFEIVDHYANDASGFSATVFRDKSSGEYTVSFRSLEYANESKGGDWLRDGRSGGGGEINGRGIAFAQVASMERYLENLQQGRRYDAASGKWVADAPMATSNSPICGHFKFPRWRRQERLDCRSKSSGRTRRTGGAGLSTAAPAGPSEARAGAAVDNPCSSRDLWIWRVGFFHGLPMTTRARRRWPDGWQPV
jgi:hypothetical protein